MHHMSFSIPPDLTLWGAVAIAFAQGLVGSVHCVGMCGPFVFMVHSQSPGITSGLLYNFSRILSYSLTGAVLGLLGSLANRFFLSSFAAYIGAAFILIWGAKWLFPNLFSSKGAQSQKEQAPNFFLRKLTDIQKKIPSKMVPVVFGMVSAFLPCGLLYPAYGLATSMGNSWAAAAVMFAFGLGTSPALLTLGLASGKLARLIGSRVYKKILGVLMLVAGLIIIILRASH